MDEEWKTVVYQQKKFENFEVSSKGRLRNVNTGTIYCQTINKNGHYQVCVSLGSRQRKKVFRVHKAVAETFIPNKEDKPYVNHKNANKLNNSVNNLEWVTPQENAQHAKEHSLLPKPKAGTDSPGARLSREQVEYIRKNYIPRSRDFGSRALGRKFGVGHDTILKVINNKSYKNV